MTLKDGMLYVAVTKEGNLLGRGPDVRYLLEGTTKDTSMSGRITQQ